MKIQPASSPAKDKDEKEEEEEDWTGWTGSAVPIAAASVVVWSVLLVATTVGTITACTLFVVGGVTYSAFVRAPRALIASFGVARKDQPDNAGQENAEDLLHKDIREMEDSLLLSCGVRARHVVLHTPDAADVHAIQALPSPSDPQGGSKKRVGVVLVHGTYSSCVTFSHCVPHFMQSGDGYDVWAVDLPGFGRSVNPKFPGALSCEKQHVTERIVQAHVDAVRSVVDATGYAQVMVVGHSLGAYVAMEYAMQYPRRVSHLVLACPPGIFPTLGSIGAYWGAMLRHSIYMQQVVQVRHVFLSARFVAIIQHVSLMQMAGSVGAAAVDGTLRLVGTSRETRESVLYWYRLNCTHQAWGVQALYHFMDFGWTHATWRRPLLSRMHALAGIQILTVYGESDTLVPSHQGVVLARLLAIPCSIMKDSGHLLFSDENGAKEFCSVVLQWHRSPALSAPPSLAHAAQRIVDGVDLASFRSNFLPGETRKTIARLYLRLGMDQATVQRILLMMQGREDKKGDHDNVL